ncbi:hypothetical protein D3C81_1427370 [compost metagenome]
MRLAPWITPNQRTRQHQRMIPGTRLQRFVAASLGSIHQLTFHFPARRLQPAEEVHATHILHVIKEVALFRLHLQQPIGRASHQINVEHRLRVTHQPDPGAFDAQHFRPQLPAAVAIEIAQHLTQVGQRTGLAQPGPEQRRQRHA